MFRVPRGIVAIQSVAKEAVTHGTHLIGRGVARVRARFEPGVLPWLKHAANESAMPVGRELSAARVALFEYFRAVVQTGHAETPSLTRQESFVVHTKASEPPDGILHLTRHVEQRLIQIQRLRDFERADDPVEAVHQLRVGSRHLRAFVEMFEGFVDPDLVRTATASLKAVTRAVRDLRDADVQVQGVLERLGHADSEPERVALSHLLTRAQRWRSSEVVLARQRLLRIEFFAMSVALRKMLDELAKRAESPSATYQVLAELAFEPMLADIEQRGLALRPLPSAEALHRYRLALKALRYAAELIEPALHHEWRAEWRRAKSLQTLLGEHQDSVEFEKMVRRRKLRAEKRQRTLLASGLGIVLTQATREREALYSRCVDTCLEAPNPELTFAPAPEPEPALARA